IDDSVSKVGEGSSQVAQAGKTMEEIVDSVKRVTDIMAEITAASQEQTQGIEQVNQAITQMDQATQQNAALVEEAAAAAASLQEQANELLHGVSVFRQGNGQARSAATPQRSSGNMRQQFKTQLPRAGQRMAAQQRKRLANPKAVVLAGSDWEAVNA
ncbi:MAG: methyl-accepting chemotaxis protein, partial [Lacisediminimonas sp.]|nr:methyl-accepting chemotaxis protein [Lacisediminimonas sp.]